MALLSTNPDGSFLSECAICGSQLTEPIFATSHFIIDPSDPLFPFSDAGMHWNCYANWEHQQSFASRHFDATRQWLFENPYWPIIAETEEFMISANPELEVSEADIDIRAIGSGFLVPICDWSRWINGEWNSSCVHELQRCAMANIEASIRRFVPDSETLQALAKAKLDTNLEK